MPVIHTICLTSGCMAWMLSLFQCQIILGLNFLGFNVLYTLFLWLLFFISQWSASFCDFFPQLQNYMYISIEMHCLISTTSCYFLDSLHLPGSLTKILMPIMTHLRQMLCYRTRIRLGCCPDIYCLYWLWILGIVIPVHLKLKHECLTICYEFGIGIGPHLAWKKY